MTTPSDNIVIVGAGLFGAAAAVELRRRGHAIVLVDPGPLPRPESSSFDISKAVRADYGADELYTRLGELAIEGWHAWNEEQDRPLYHQTGFLVLSSTPMTDEGYEGASYRTLQRRGHAVRRLDGAGLRRLLPALSPGAWVDGYLNPGGGWVESGEVVRRLIDRARATGVEVREGARFEGLLESDAGVSGIRTADGGRIEGDRVIVAAGAWTPALLPWLADVMWPTGHPVFHLDPDRAAAHEVGAPVWAADIARTGWYGFPRNAAGIVKIANHGPGGRAAPTETNRAVDGESTAAFRRFLAAGLGSLKWDRIVGGRVCFYCDTWDGNFWIDRDPARPGLVVAAGGSGHGFKFAPLLGGIVADVVEGIDNEFAPRFAWRERGGLTGEDARQLE